MRTSLNRSLPVTTVALVLSISQPLLLWAADPQEDDQFSRELQTAKTAKDVQDLVDKTSQRLGRAIAKLEHLLVENIRTNGAGGRFVIREITPDQKLAKGSLTLRENPKGGVMGVVENSGDSVPINLGEIGIRGLQATSGSRWIPNVFSKRDDGTIKPTNDVPGGDGSVHRYSGMVPVPGQDDHILLVGEGERSERLTFALVEDVGYVYLRGKGKIGILKDGKLSKLFQCEDGSCREVDLAEKKKDKEGE